MTFPCTDSRGSVSLVAVYCLCACLVVAPTMQLMQILEQQFVFTRRVRATYGFYSPSIFHVDSELMDTTMCTLVCLHVYTHSSVRELK